MAPKSYFEPVYFVLLVRFTYHPIEDAQHQKIEIYESGIKVPIS